VEHYSSAIKKQHLHKKKHMSHIYSRLLLDST